LTEASEDLGNDDRSIVAHGKEITMNTRKALVALAAAATVSLAVAAAPASPASALPCTNCDGPTDGGTTTLPKMAQYSVQWSSFEQMECVTRGDQRLCAFTPDSLLPGNDNITLTDLGSTSAGYIRVTLRTAANVTWYKEIKAFDSNGNAIGWISTQDGNHGDVTMTLSVSRVAALVFTKAGFLGVRYGVYDLRNVVAKSGRHVRFDWTAD
jgi:hypothetical protein